MELTYDLHIHSCLSPCGDEDMTPANIVGMAAIKNLDCIALTDHNSCKNCPAAAHFAKEYGVMFIPGMELTTMEEVHVVCLFPTLDEAMQFDQLVYERLLPVQNDEQIFGRQIIRNEDDEECGKVEHLLINATSILFDDVFDLLKPYRGVMIPAHIDKSANSLLANLGFVPPTAKFRCAELRDLSKLHELQKSNEYLKGCTIITDSDAHYLEHINEPVHSLYVNEKTVDSVLSYLSK